MSPMLRQTADPKTIGATTGARGSSHMGSSSQVQPAPSAQGFEQLQQSLGNRALSELLRAGLLRPKLRIGAPDDAYEREADRGADQGMGMAEPGPDDGMSRSGEGVHATPKTVPHVQRVCGDCEEELQRQSEGEQQIRRQASDEEDEIRRQPHDDEEILQRRTDDEDEIQRRPVDEEEELEIQRDVRSEGAAREVSPDAQQQIHSLQGGGRPLPPSARAFFEPRFGHDLGNIRVHTGKDAEEAARSVNARAFTLGRDIVFGAGDYTPQSSIGRHLLAHELTHVVQQGLRASTEASTVHRQEDVTYEEPIFEPTDAELDVMEEGNSIERTGVVQTDDGANLWPQTNRRKPKLGLLPQNTRVFVDREVGGGWYSVYVAGHQRGESLPVREGTHGYVEASRINSDMPDPGAWLFRITKGGQGALDVAKEAYKDNFKAAWGKDYRYLVNVLVFVNEAKDRRGFYKDNSNDTWDKTKTKLNAQIWIPGLKLVDALHSQIASGSISYEVLSTVGDIGIGVAAFIVGLLHGALMSIADVFIGAYDLIKIAGEIIIKLFKGTLISDAKAFFDEISKIEVSDIIEMVGAKWNHANTWDRWKFRGYVIGYAVVEILLLYFSVGIVTAVKWAGKAGKVGKLATYLSKLPQVQKITSAAKTLKGKGIDKLRAALKAAQALSEAHGWAARVLRIPMQILRRLREADIGKLKKLPQWARERFARLATTAKFRILGCTSPCKVDFRKVQEYLQNLAAKGATGAKKLGSVDDVLQALPSGLKNTKIAQKLKKKPALMKAIKEAELTDADFGKLKDFVTPGDLASPAQAYRTFVRYLTGVVPAKTGKDIKKLNEVLEKIVKAEPRRGAALKGAMFEQWVALHLPELASRTFQRITFDLRKLLNKTVRPYSRPVDKWVPDKGEIWEIKHQLSKVPIGQADDFAGLLGKTAPDGNMVKGVNYLFPTKAAAEANEHLATAYKFGVYYVDEATNTLMKFK